MKNYRIFWTEPAEPVVVLRAPDLQTAKDLAQSYQVTAHPGEVFSIKSTEEVADDAWSYDVEGVVDAVTGMAVTDRNMEDMTDEAFLKQFGFQ